MVTVRTAKEAAEALVRGLKLLHGQITLEVHAGQVTLARAGLTLKPEALEDIELEEIEV